MTNIAQNIIHKCGGPAVIAEWLGIKAVSVYRWTYDKDKGGTGGLIPAERQIEILDAAKRHGVPLTAADFFPSDLSGAA